MTKKQGVTIQRVAVRTQTKERLHSLARKKEHMLNSVEEAVLRMHHGISINEDVELASNMINDEVQQKLLEIELRAFEQTGRLDEMLNGMGAASLLPSNQSTRRIIDKLKN